MNALNCFLITFALCISISARANQLLPATDDNGANVQNFDSQVIDIFKDVVEHPKPLPFSPDTGTSDQKKVLKAILEKFANHEMFLKNVVYRTDTNVIRVTWGDRKNDYVVKVAYKTGKDKVLSNSLYADKQGVFDVKIAYRRPDSEYDYLRLENLKFVKVIENGTPVDHDGYSVEYELSNEQCRFCHILAKHDGSPSGLFFPRYQEGQGSNGLEGMSAFFDPGKLELKKSAESVALGLPAMKDDFYYLHTAQLGTIDKDSEKILQTLVELPQLIEVMARDNHKSYCLLIDTGEIGEKLGLGRDDYICADNAAKELHVKMTNSSIFNKKGPLVYTEPYFKK
jgi:hypothetical protein